MTPVVVIQQAIFITALSFALLSGASHFSFLSDSQASSHHWTRLELVSAALYDFL